MQNVRPVLVKELSDARNEAALVGAIDQKNGCIGQKGLSLSKNTASILQAYRSAMCGIVGYLDRSGTSNSLLGSTVLGMLQALGCRGPDSAGVALFGPGEPDHFIARVKLGDDGHCDALETKVAAAAQPFGARAFAPTESYLRFTIRQTPDLNGFLSSVESAGPDVEVVSLGRRLEIVKQVGSPANLDSSYNVSSFCGSHGIGHTRLSTESIVDLSHSQPFWSHGCLDLAIAHNGHITNYHQLRRRFEQRGIRFYTGNDSEIVAIYLGGLLREGRTLSQALNSMLVDLDGSFSCLAATDTEIGFAKDAFSLKPLLFAESDTFVAVATEEIAIRAAIPGVYDVREAQAKEVRVWRR